MTNVSAWSISAGSNNSAPPAGAPEGMLPGKVNDCIREVMAAVARWYSDVDGSLVTGGSGDAYTLTTNSGYTALADLPLLVFQTDRANTGIITLEVDGLGALTVYKNAGGIYQVFGPGDVFSGQVMVVKYNTGGWFDYIGPSVDGFQSGTHMLFQQTSTPIGWTKYFVFNDTALRVTTGTAGSGGATGFSSIFTSRTLTTGNIPLFNVNVSGGSVVTGNINGVSVGAGGTNIITSANLVNGSVSIGNLSPTALNFAVSYVDVIIGVKD